MPYEEWGTYKVRVKWKSGDLTEYTAVDLEDAYKLIDLNRDCIVVKWVGLAVNGVVTACYKGAGDVEVLST